MTMVCRSPPKGSSTLRGRVKVEAWWLKTTRATVNNNLILLWTWETLITARSFLTSKFDIMSHFTCYVAPPGCYKSDQYNTLTQIYIEAPLSPPFPCAPFAIKTVNFQSHYKLEPWTGHLFPGQFWLFRGWYRRFFLTGQKKLRKLKNKNLVRCEEFVLFTQLPLVKAL